MAMELWLAFRLLLARPRQTVLSILSVTLGVAALIVMRSMTLGFLQQFVDKLIELTAHVTALSEELSVYFSGDKGEQATLPVRQGWTVEDGFPLPTLFTTTRPPIPRQRKGIAGWEALLTQIERLPDVVSAAPYVALEGIVVFGSRSEVVGVLGIEPLRYNRTLSFRRWLLTGDMMELQRNPNSIILGYALAKELGARVGDRVTVLGRNGATATLRVVGLYRSRVTLVDRFRAFAPLRTVQRLKGTERVDAIAVRLTNLERAKEVAQKIRQMTGLETQTWEDFGRSIAAIFRMIDMITTLVVLTIVVVAGFGITITLLLLVSEKRGFIGVMKAAGMTPGRIARSFLLAGLIIATVGIGLGEVVGWIGIEVLDRTPTGLRGFATFVESETFPMLRRWDLYALAAIAAFIVVVIASWFPARRAASFDPVAILRGE